jgi:cytochrome c-type biogenesis protein CcmF
MPDIGFYAIRSALFLAFFGVGAGIHAGLMKREEWTKVSERSLYLCTALIALAMGCLFISFATLDFQVAFVANHVARSMSLPYRLAALWGGQAGSLMLWLFMLLLYGSAAVFINRNQHRRLMPWVTVTMLTNALFFLVLINFISNPFDKLPPEMVLSDGTGLNPLLQHPVMLIHPLFLYAGMTGFAIPFSFAFAALVTGQLGNAWLKTTRRWTLFSWFMLSIGVLLGGRWAYEVLGWGGYWAWDPVENASCMPWIAASAYLHSVIIQEKRDMLKIWNMVLIGLTYGLCLFGTYITRSGLVSSVHSFAQSSTFGIIFGSYVLLFLVIFFGALYLRRGDLKSARKLESIVSREASFILNNWAFMGLLIIVMWGTMFPVLSELFLNKKIAVGPAWFSFMASVPGVLLLLLTGVGPLIAWRKATPSHLKRQFTFPLAWGGVVGIAALAVYGTGIDVFSWCAWTFSGFVIASITQEYTRAIRSRKKRAKQSSLQALRYLLAQNPSRYGGYVVHLGVVFMMIGFSGSAFNKETLENIQVGEEIRIEDYSLTYLTADVIPAKHYGGARARFALRKAGVGLATMTPEKRLYWVEQQPASIPAIYTGLREDVYIILNQIEADGSATLKVHINPLVSWIWIGGYILLLGTVIIIWPHPERQQGAQA